MSNLTAFCSCLVFLLPKILAPEVRRLSALECSLEPVYSEHTLRFFFLSFIETYFILEYSLHIAY